MGVEKLVVLFTVLLLVSCKSFDKEHFKARNFYEKNKKELANLCAAEFPSETKYIKGDTIVVVKEIKSEPFFVDCPDGSKAKCPESKTVYKTIYQTDTIVKPNTAFEDKQRYKINDLESDNTLLIKENETLKNDLKQAEKESSKKDWIIGGLGVLCVIGLIVIIKR